MLLWGAHMTGLPPLQALIFLYLIFKQSGCHMVLREEENLLISECVDR